MCVSCFSSLRRVVVESEASALCRVPRANLRLNLSVQSSEEGPEVQAPPGWRGAGMGGTSEVPTVQLINDFGRSTCLDLSN